MAHKNACLIVKDRNYRNRNLKQKERWEIHRILFVSNIAGSVKIILEFDKRVL